MAFAEPSYAVECRNGQDRGTRLAIRASLRPSYTLALVAWKQVTVHNTQRMLSKKSRRHKTDCSATMLRGPGTLPLIPDIEHPISTSRGLLNPTADLRPTAWPDVHHCSRPTAGFVTTWQRRSTQRSTPINSRQQNNCKPRPRLSDWTTN